MSAPPMPASSVPVRICCHDLPPIERVPLQQALHELVGCLFEETFLQTHHPHGFHLKPQGLW